MRIKHMTITLPPRLRQVAEHQARGIAQQAAEELARGGRIPGDIRMEMPGNGLSGPALAHSVARGIAGRKRGQG